MSSQEEYLDQLLRNIMNGGKGESQQEADAEEMNTAEMTDIEPEMAGEKAEVPEISETSEMAEMDGVPGMDEISGTPETSGRPDEAAVMPEIYGMSGMGEMPEMPETSGRPDEAAVMPEIYGMSDMGEMPETPETSGRPDEAAVMPEIYGMSGMDEMPGMSDEAADMHDDVVMPDISEMSEMPDAAAIMDEMPNDITTMSEMPELSGISEMSDILGNFENDSDILGTPVEDTDLEALLKRFEDTDTVLKEDVQDSSEGVDISSMSEEDIDRLLAENRGMPENSMGSQEETFQGDVVDLLEGTKDSELQEIQDLLEKSDNNEAVGDEIKDILREAAQDSLQNSSADDIADDSDAAEEQMSPRQRKAMEKKRMKEEKAAARKAAKEARKAEKEARKAARKAGKDGGTQDTGSTPSVTSGGSAAGEAVDTAFLDSILSEAGKINSAETLSSATGNFDAKVDNIIQDESEDASVAKNAESSYSVKDDLGIDLNNLFGGSAEAESAMMAGGDSDLAGFGELDGNDVTGLRELTEDEEKETKPKKGFFSRFLEFLTEEDEEEEENEDIKLSEENQEILEDLDKEKNQKKDKGKKGKKKAKKADTSAEDGEEGEDDEGSGKGKKKKVKKPKKEKLPEEKEPVEPGKRLSLKKALPIMLICLSLGIAIIITVYAFVDFTGNRAARDAYYDGDYQTCYQYLYGKDMDETEQIMYGKSQSILTIRLWIREYEMLMAGGAELEALDSLIQSVNDYPVLYEYAGQWNAAGEVAQEYATVLNLLYENYGLTEDQARAIAAEKDDIEYTRQVNAIAQGGAYGSWNEPEPEVDVPLRDELPEETELPEGSFIDTNTSMQ